MLGVLSIIAIICAGVLGLIALLMVGCLLWYHHQLFNYMLYEDRWNSKFEIEELPDEIKIEDLV